MFQVDDTDKKIHNYVEKDKNWAMLCSLRVVY